MSADATRTDYSEESDLNPPRRGLKKGLYILPSIFTAANIGMGFYAVMSALRGFQLLQPGGSAADAQFAGLFFDNAARAICIALLFDMIDGRVARMTKTTTEIGVQLDSLADVLTFGIAPAVLAYAWGYGVALGDEDPFYKLGLFLSFMFLICGALRLARFNVQASRPRILAEGAVKVDKKNFIGLPIPPAACMIASIIHFSPTPLSPVVYGPERARLYSILLMTLVGLLGMLMVSTIRYTSFKTVGTGRRSTRLVILLVAGIGMSIWLFSRYALLTLVAAYVMHGILFRAFGFLRRRAGAPEPV